jgi:hypothetical protein
VTGRRRYPTLIQRPFPLLLCCAGQQENGQQKSRGLAGFFGWSKLAPLIYRSRYYHTLCVRKLFFTLAFALLLEQPAAPLGSRTPGVSLIWSDSLDLA